MSSREMIPVVCQDRGIHGRSQVVWFGQMDTLQDPRTGDIITRERREFLPAHLCFFDVREGKLYLPRWLAKKRGFIRD